MSEEPRSSSRATGVLARIGSGVWTAFAAPLVLIGLVAWQGPAIQDRLEPPRCDDPDGLELLETSASETDAPVTVTAESTLATRAAFPAGYAADHLIDGDYRTAWLEGDPAGPGIHQTVTFEFSVPLEVQMICLVNGWARSADFFKRNGRPRIFEVTTDAGTVRASLDDKPLDAFTAYQELEVPKGTTRSVTLEILAVNAPYGVDDGDVIDEDDTAISEVEFWIASSG